MERNYRLVAVLCGDGGEIVDDSGRSVEPLSRAT
jgi:hypothetical protein